MTSGSITCSSTDPTATSKTKEEGFVIAIAKDNVPCIVSIIQERLAGGVVGGTAMGVGVN